MPLEERQLRMFQLKKRERRMDVDAWVRSFLQEMDAIHGISSNLKDNLQNLIKGFLMSFCYIPIRALMSEKCRQMARLRLFS